ncbi:serine--pyruvate aminotransferase [Orussus abietinus]|uniref:serine--pyruvate aminotransferase n=1 Tax=Orussus abietinus TaxID=222816 RepID=UPI0006256EFF|nr:serine--pyruvate aminotransferase [Orussus abietinus]XP_012277763.1 serine--pyruvate aminotransferase [Orussus abietinus]
MSSGWQQHAVKIEAPKELLKPLHIPDRILMGPGPSNCSQRVLESLRNQVLGHLHPETLQLMDEIKAGLRYAFQTNNRLTLALSASGHAGMEAGLENILEPGETLLVTTSSIWGERAAEMADRIGVDVHFLGNEIGVPFSREQLESAMVTYKPTAVFVVHGESSTGLKQPLEGLGDIVHKYGALLVVDTVASLGAEPFHSDAFGVDVVYTGSQKGLSGPPGITPISFSPRAEKKIFKRKTKVPVFYWDMTVLGEYWRCFGRPALYHHTISATLVYGLREALAQLVEETLQRSWRRHAEAAEKLQQGLQERGFKLFIDNPEHRLNTITVVVLPDGVDWRLLLQRLINEHGIEIAGGLGSTAGKVLRIGLMGFNSNCQNVNKVLRALDDCLQDVMLFKRETWKKSRL